MAYNKKTKKTKKNVGPVVVSVSTTFNNTLVTIADPIGNVLLSSSAGKLGFKGARKGTPFAGTQVANAVAKSMVSMGVTSLEINLRGPGSGRESVVRAFQSTGIPITVLRDVTPLPHNGCRPPKKRRG